MSAGGDGSSVGLGEVFNNTPRRVQKRLFTSGTSSSKRTLFRDTQTASPSGGNSGDESDLGPMSPLALSDATPSSATNSPGKSLTSPVVGSTAAALVYLGSLDSNLWEMGTLNMGHDEANVVPSSPFSVLKTLTRSARYSQRRKTCPVLPEPVIPINDENEIVKETPPTSPKRSGKSSAWNESITETPKRKSFGKEIQNVQILDSSIIAETPYKDDSPMRRLITPLGSVSKEAALPRLHHRKSLNSLAATAQNSSPIDGKENILKRTARDVIIETSAKLFKTDECTSAPKARAALFQERQQDFKVSTKVFYSSSPPQVLPKQDSPINIEQSEVRHGQKRRSLPNRSSRGRSSKRHKYGEINAGIGHRIRKPKVKKHISLADGFKKENVNDVSPIATSTETSFAESNVRNITQNMDNTLPNIHDEHSVEKCAMPQSRELAASPEIDTAKKFFKTNRTVSRKSLATVTVNDSIKLQVSHGKVKLESHRFMKRQNPHKKARISDLSLDANDLTVDDPSFGVPIDKTSVDNILKVLEDDWADDEYDTMEPLISTQKYAISPLKSSIILNGMSMSPASELTSMTSVMNIKDAYGPTANLDQVSSNLDNSNQNKGTKLYPLFNKDFARTKSLIDSPKNVTRGTKRPAGWQLSAKNGAQDDRQYQLDVGQKQFGATQCPECRVVYQIGDPSDETSHQNYHDSMKILKFPGWKHERVVTTDSYTSSRIILVEASAPKYCWKKVSEILAVIDRDLGLADSKLSDYHNDKIYLYIREKEILGVLVAEYVTTGYRLIPDLQNIDCCSLQSSSIKCGIKVVWTAASYRKQGIATKLVDVLRANFYFGYVLSMDDIAFSIPTPGGKAFAEKYTSTKCFKVYN
ncbi:N-acetyltransferase ESCO1 [Neodiprion lecontei]|uniref:N-acetyltransferase ESCO1 n=1 Tax=Neodiprion lecontei TaxID=441921 RepID=A0A6J0BSH2_NEOLC|nr:N-acetyltransferase ESCO1 [Neodiprion lecontei]